jgi:hypothetical protein
LANIVANRLSIDFQPVGMSVVYIHRCQYKPWTAG